MDQSEKIQLGPVSEEVILRGLFRRPITKGDVLTVPGLTLMGGRLPFGVIEVQPKGIIQLQADTVIQVHETSIKEEELTKTKEDIRLEKLEKIKQREEALDFDTAIEIWEELGEISEAARVRKLKTEQSAVKVDQTVVHGDYVDDRDTIVKDSVINRSNVGGGSSKMQELKDLAEMKEKGLIDDDEFKQMKKEILGK